MLDFHGTTAQEIMIPRVKIDAIPSSITVNEAIDRLLEFSHTRIPVYQKSIDHIEWFVMLKELIFAQKAGK